MSGSLKQLKLLLETQKWLNLNTKAPSCQKKWRSLVWVSNQIRFVACKLLFISIVIKVLNCSVRLLLTVSTPPDSSCLVQKRLQAI